MAEMSYEELKERLDAAEADADDLRERLATSLTREQICERLNDSKLYGSACQFCEAFGINWQDGRFVP